MRTAALKNSKLLSFHTVLAVPMQHRQLRLAPSIFHECTSYSHALDCTGSSGMHLRRLFPHSAAIMLSCNSLCIAVSVSLAYMLRSLVLLHYVAIIIDGRFKSRLAELRGCVPGQPASKPVELCIRS